MSEDGIANSENQGQDQANTCCPIEEPVEKTAATSC
jgi:hypothetical protein